jgi:hypothetical protein
MGTIFAEVREVQGRLPFADGTKKAAQKPSGVSLFTDSRAQLRLIPESAA